MTHDWSSQPTGLETKWEPSRSGRKGSTPGLGDRKVKTGAHVRGRARAGTGASVEKLLGSNLRRRPKWSRRREHPREHLIHRHTRAFLPPDSGRKDRTP